MCRLTQWRSVVFTEFSSVTRHIFGLMGTSVNIASFGLMRNPKRFFTKMHSLLWFMGCWNHRSIFLQKWYHDTTYNRQWRELQHHYNEKIVPWHRCRWHLVSVRLCYDIHTHRAEEWPYWEIVLVSTQFCPVNRPLRSCDITTCGFFFSGYKKLSAIS